MSLGWEKRRGRILDHFDNISISCPQCGKLIGPKHKKPAELWCKDCDILFNISSKRNNRNGIILLLIGCGITLLIPILLPVIHWIIAG